MAETEIRDQRDRCSGEVGHAVRKASADEVSRAIVETPKNRPITKAVSTCCSVDPTDWYARLMRWNRPNRIAPITVPRCTRQPSPLAGLFPLPQGEGRVGAIQRRLNQPTEEKLLGRTDD